MRDAPEAPRAVLAAPGGGGRWLAFRDPVQALVARRPDEVRGTLEAAEAAARRGLWVAGFLAYEAAPGLDAALAASPPGDLPLAWWGVFEAPSDVSLAAPQEDGFRLSRWEPSITAAEHRAGVEAIRRAIARGDTYQVNFTYRLSAAFEGPPWRLFLRLWGAQPAACSAFVDAGSYVLCSVSPELFFERRGPRVVTRPMKGTAPRALTTEGDRRRRAWLARSAKNRAENLMIVDMMRNDLGRVARPGSVRVSSLFDVERHDSLFQMTSTVEAESDAPTAALLAALFPSASVTGAPKASTMRLIRDLEGAPRGAYTGAIGCLAPGGEARFSVAIRTVEIDVARGRALYGTGGGIVWESDADDEYRECQTKTLVLTRPRPRFALLETLRWGPRGGYWLLERHLARLRASAEYFDVDLDEREARARLEGLGATLPPRAHRVRLLLSTGDGLQVEAAPLAGGSRRWRVALAGRPVDRDDRFLYHKTTHREAYDTGLAAAPGCDDVLLWNADGQLTESTRANLVLRLAGSLLTPPVECGLLAGTFRAELLERRRIRERILYREHLAAAERVYLVNSLRGWLVARLDGRPSDGAVPAG